jgi:Tfp pilus assembly PilM family ATPase
MLALLKKVVRRSHADNSPTDSQSRTVKEMVVRPVRLFHTGRRIAIQIEEDAVHMVASKQFLTSVKITAVESVELSGKQLGPAEKADAAANIIHDFIERHGRRRARTTLLVSGRETVYRIFTMPVLKPRQLASALEFEAKRQVPFPLEECRYDYRPLYRFTNGDKDSYKVALQAATKRMIQQRLEIFEAIDVQLDEIIYAPDVVGTLLDRAAGDHSSLQRTLVAIYADHSEISFYRGSNLEFLHISSTGSDVLGGQDDDTTLEYFAELLATEVQTSIDYYTGQISRQYSERVSVYGPMAKRSRLIELLGEKTGLGFSPFSLEHVDLSFESAVPDPILLSSMLPVVAGAVNNGALPNLLPAPQKRELRDARRAVRAKSALVAATALLTAATVVYWGRRTDEQAAMERLDQQVAAFESSPGFHTYNILKRRLATDQSYLDQIKEAPSTLNLDLKELSNLTPSAIQLTVLAYNPADTMANMQITGVVRSDRVPPEVILAEYVETLNASPFFSDVAIARHVKRTVRRGFTIDFHLTLRGLVS